MDHNCILFFVKYPERGQVKRRLAASLGEVVATEIYAAFVLDSLATLDTCRARVMVCFYPPSAKKRIISWLGRHHAYLPQRGGDLGQRMKNGLQDAFDRGFQQAVIVGSDIPDLPAEVIESALASLNTRDAVVGPSVDGGYYLIGFRHDTFLPQAFEGIAWGTETVYKETVTILENRDLAVASLPRWNDIDTAEDLKELLYRSRHTPFCSSKTISCIEKHAALLK